MKKEKSVIEHFMVIGGGTVLNILIGLLTTPIITRLVDPIEYGQLSIFTMYGSIALMILCLGLDQAMVRFYYLQDSEDYQNTLMRFCLRISLSIAFLIILISTILISTGIVKIEFSSRISILLGVYIIVLIMNRFAILALRVRYKSNLYSAVNVLQKIVYVVSALFMIKNIGKNHFELLVIATMVSVLISTLVALFAEKEVWFRKKAKVLLKKKEIITYGLPFIISLGITQFFQAIDKISLNYYCSYSEVGVYSSAMTFISLFSVIQSTFNTLWAPMATEHYEKAPNDKEFFQKANQVITVIMFFVGIHLIFCKDIFVLLLGEKYREAAHIMPFLIFNPIMLTISETTCCGIGFLKKSYMHIWVGVGACITNLLGNMLLVPQLGCKGAAISTGISYVVYFILRTFISNRYYYVDFATKKLGVLTIIVAFYALYSTFLENNIISFFFYLVCMITLIALYKETFGFIIERIKEGF